MHGDIEALGYFLALAWFIIYVLPWLILTALLGYIGCRVWKKKKNK